MFRRFAGFVLMGAALGGAGCSTIGTLTSSQDHPWLYSGTRKNCEPFDESLEIPYRGIVQFFAFLDFPFSLVLDTALIPLTLPLQLIVGGEFPERMRVRREQNSDR